MDSNFSKFKKKILMESIFKCLLISLSFGIIVFSILFLLDKLEIFSFNIIYSILIAIGLIAIIFGISLLIYKPKNMKVAKRIDNEFNLNEKVQTMVAFESKEGDIITLQREDTKDRLSKISIKSLKLKFNLFHIIIPILALALCITSLAIPASAKNNDNGDDIINPDEQKEWYILVIENIIEEVKKQDINDEIKSKYVDELYNLIDVLVIAETEDDFIVGINNTIERVKIDTDLNNSNNDIFELLRYYPGAVSQYANYLNKLNVTEVSKILNNMIAQICVAPDPQNPDAQTNALKDFRNSFFEDSLAISTRMDRYRNIKDPLYIAMEKLSDDLLDAYSAGDNDAIHAVIREVFAEDSPAIIEAVQEQRNVQDTCDYIEDELLALFNKLTNNDDNTDDDDDGSNDNENNDQDKDDEQEFDNPGGLGTGDLILGSDDIIYDPEKGYVQYAEVIDQYHQQLLLQFSDGNIPDEYKDLFNKYFEMLYTVKDADNEASNNNGK